MLLAWLSPCFQSLPSFPTSKLGPFGAASWVGGFVYILGPHGPLQWILQWGFLPPPQTPQIFTARGSEAFFSIAGSLSCAVSLAPQLFLLIYLHVNVGPPILPAAPSPAWSASLPCVFTPAACLHPSYQSLIPWLLDFHTVLFSGSSGCLCFKIGCYPFCCMRK